MSLPPQLHGQQGRAISGIVLLIGFVTAFTLWILAFGNPGNTGKVEAVGGITGTFSGVPVEGEGTWNNNQGGPCLDPKGNPRWYLGINWDAGSDTNDTLLSNQEYLEPLACTGDSDPATRNWGPIACDDASNDPDSCETVSEPCVTLYHAARGNTQGQDVAATTCELIPPTPTNTATNTPTNTPTPTDTPTNTPTPTDTPTNTPTPTDTPTNTPTSTPEPPQVVDCPTARDAGLLGEPRDPKKVTLCHFTGSTTNPVIINEVSLSSAETHADHHGDLWNCGSQADILDPTFCAGSVGNTPTPTPTPN